MPRRLGQHFLTDERILRRIAGALEIVPEDIVIEIGPGHGELTNELVAFHPSHLALIEKDPLLVEALRAQHAPGTAVSVYAGDVRDVLADVVAEVAAERPYKVVGNIPYYLTGFLLRILGELPHQPSSVVLTMQAEVAERLVARAPAMNKLAASVQFWADPTMLFTIPAGAFHPAPEVTSATVRLVAKPLPMDRVAYFSFVRQLFQQPRKNIMNNLVPKNIPEAEKVKRNALLASLGVDPHARPQNMDMERIVTLAKAFSA